MALMAPCLDAETLQSRCRLSMWPCSGTTCSTWLTINNISSSWRQWRMLETSQRCPLMRLSATWSAELSTRRCKARLDRLLHRTWSKTLYHSVYAPSSLGDQDILHHSNTPTRTLLVWLPPSEDSVTEPTQPYHPTAVHRLYPSIQKLIATSRQLLFNK